MNLFIINFILNLINTQTKCAIKAGLLNFNMCNIINLEGEFILVEHTGYNNNQVIIAHTMIKISEIDFLLGEISVASLEVDN